VQFTELQHYSDLTNIQQNKQTKIFNHEQLNLPNDIEYLAFSKKIFASLFLSKFFNSFPLAENAKLYFLSALFIFKTKIKKTFKHLLLKILF